MGFAWETMRFARVPEHALVLQEIEGTISRKWPIIWHFGQYWYLLRVTTASARQPYYLYRYLEGHKRVSRYHLLIHTPQVMVQVGPEKSYFWAETRTHQPLSLVTTDTKEPGFLVRKKTKKSRTEINKN